MTRVFQIPGEEPFEIEHLLLDINGTLTDRGSLLPGVGKRIGRLRRVFEVHLLSADTFGTLDQLARGLRVEGRRIATGSEKRELVRELGAEHCAAIGNGRNDAEMLSEVRLGIAVLGPEGLHRAAASVADVICPSIQAALDLLLDPKALAATLRP
jgi:soluble P-type ATPase